MTLLAVLVVGLVPAGEAEGEAGEVEAAEEEEALQRPSDLDRLAVVMGDVVLPAAIIAAVIVAVIAAVTVAAKVAVIMAVITGLDQQGTGSSLP